MEQKNPGNHIYNECSDGNIVEIDSLPNTMIKYYGSDSEIIVKGDINSYNVKHARISVGHNSKIIIGENFRVRFEIQIDARADNTSICFGKNVNIGEINILGGDEPNLSLSIGDDFLNSLGCYIRLADGHTIIDMRTNEVINIPKSGITIGDHVWVGYDVIILKDSSIPSNSVVGAGSLIANHFYEENSIIAGVPARIIRNEISWNSSPIHKFK